MSNTQTTPAPATQQQPTTFISLHQFKGLVNCNTIQIVQNPKEGGKLFANADNGIKYKVQQAIILDGSKPIKVLVPMTPDGEMLLNDACITNVTETDNVKATL